MLKCLIKVFLVVSRNFNLVFNCKALSEIQLLVNNACTMIFFYFSFSWNFSSCKFISNRIQSVSNVFSSFFVLENKLSTIQHLSYEQKHGTSLIYITWTCEINISLIAWQLIWKCWLTFGSDLVKHCNC